MCCVGWWAALRSPESCSFCLRLVFAMLGEKARGQVEDFLHTLPCTDFAFAYGSAVFSQESSKDNKKDGGDRMLDVILLVDDPLDWHSENIKLNRHHYGPIASLGARTVQWISQQGAGLHFNPFVTFGGQSLKYGVIRAVDAQQDLNSWQHMYLAGRMHKPIDTISDTAVCKCIQRAILNNRIAAMTAAVLLQREKRFHVQQLLRTIVNLSYTGDVRMALAEDSNKVDNIVSGSMGLLQDIYTKAILKHDTFNEVTPPLTTGRSRSTDELQMPSLSTQQRWVASLPAAALLEAASRQRIPHPERSSFVNIPAASAGQPCSMCGPQQDLLLDIRQDLADRLCHTGTPSLWLPGALAAIVSRSSRRQSLAGLLATSPGKSLAYVGAKLQKRFRSLLP